MAEITKDFLEYLSRLEHDQWCDWSKSVASDMEKLINLIDLDNLDNEDSEFVESQKQRLDRWSGFWVDYDVLDEAVKEQDREYARKVIDAFNEINLK